MRAGIGRGGSVVRSVAAVVIEAEISSFASIRSQKRRRTSLVCI